MIQRVTSCYVTVDGVVVGAIQQGLNLIVGITDFGTKAELEWMTRKCLKLRISPLETGSLNQSVQDIAVSCW